MMDTEEHLLFTLDPEPAPSSDHEAITAVLVRPTSNANAGVARYEQTYVEPVRRLRASLSDVLDTDGHPERAPEEALSMLKEAMDTFNEESSTWL